LKLIHTVSVRRFADLRNTESVAKYAFRGLHQLRMGLFWAPVRWVTDACPDGVLCLSNPGHPRCRRKLFPPAALGCCGLAPQPLALLGSRGSSSPWASLVPDAVLTQEGKGLAPVFSLRSTRPRRPCTPAGTTCNSTFDFMKSQFRHSASPNKAAPSMDVIAELNYVLLFLDEGQ